MGKKPKPPKPKPVNYDLVDKSHPAWKILLEARNKWHKDMYDARVGLAWRKRMKADVDGHVKLGHCSKVGDFHKEYIPYDFVIVLNRDMWDVLEPHQHLAILDHEMCHTSLSLDKEFQRKEDEKGRTVYRVRKHDIEEFKSVIEHHGLYKSDLENFAKAILEKKATPLLAGLEPAPPPDRLQAALERAAEMVNAGALDTDGVKCTAEVSRG